MRFIVCLTLLTGFCLLSCEKEEIKSFEEATILGPDLRRCASPFCGGWFFRVNNDTLRFLNIPSGQTLEGFGDTFPYPVFVKYQKYEGDWSQIEELVEVIEIKKRD